jgi:hypothetical protein
VTAGWRFYAHIEAVPQFKISTKKNRSTKAIPKINTFFSSMLSPFSLSVYPLSYLKNPPKVNSEGDMK